MGVTQPPIPCPTEGCLVISVLMSSRHFSKTYPRKEACRGATAFVAIPLDTRGWLHRPSSEERTSTYQGEERSKRVVVSRAQSPWTVAALAAGLPISRWYRRTVAEGTQGPLTYVFARQRVTLGKEGLPARTVWLVLKRTLEAAPSYSAYISNAPECSGAHTLEPLCVVEWPALGD